MSLTLGEKLRQAREERGISISEVAENTRISPHYIKSIENDDYKPLPGGIFNKGFIKSYAKFIGVDENEALQDYAQLISSEQEVHLIDDGPRSYRPEVLTDDRQMESKAPTIIFAVIILGLMTAGILFVVKFLQNRSSEPAVSVSNAASETNSSITNSALPAEPSPTTNSGAGPAAAPDKISIQLRAEREPVWIRYSTDGNAREQTLAAEETVTVEPANTFSISYSKSKIDNLKVNVNGRSVTPPDSPKGTVDFSINKQNIAEIMQSGRLPTAAAPATPVRPAARPSPLAPATPRPTATTTPRPAANSNRR